MKNIEEFHWILASGSPRRKELLEQIGIRPQIIPSGMELVQVAILIGIAVAVGLIFRMQITDFVNAVFTTLADGKFTS